jgi:hypothetical protein
VTAALYQVVDWNIRHENNRSREIDRCAYMMAPNDQGPVFYAISDNPNGEAVLGVWHAILCLCASQRKPRHGYLTNNGKADGWRLSPEELAHIWKFSPASVRRALDILSNPRVGLIRLVDEKCDVGRTQGAATTAGEVRRPPQAKCGDHRTQGALEGVNVQKERKKESTETPYSPPEGDHTRRSFEVEQAKEWVNSLFTPRRKMAWSYEEEQLLSELLPIDPELRALLSWAYSLPRDDEGWALFGDQQLNKPKTNCIRLLREFGSEVEKWRMARAALNGALNEDDDGWTMERMALRDELFPGTEWPEQFRQLSVDVQRRFNAVVLQRREKNA